MIDKYREKYYHQVFGKEDLVLSAIHEESKAHGIENMQLSAADAHIIQFLTKACKIQKCIEIGGLFGYSTLHIARGLPHDGKIYSLDINQERQKKSQELLKKTADFHKISWVHGNAKNSLKTLEKEAPFDMVFIDADKVSYYTYLLWAEKYLKVGGIVIADNAFLFDTLYTPHPELEKLKKDHHVSNKSIEVIKEFNNRITSSKIWMGAMIPSIDGMVVAYKIRELENE